VTPRPGGRWWTRRAVVGLVVAAQLVLVVRAYWADHDVFGFQMFPESSQWQAEIVRVDADGTRHDVRDPWPGGYRWGDLVTSRGLGDPFTRGHADTGLASTTAFLRAALDWVARNTPDDPETVYLEAVVTLWDNGRGPRNEVYRSVIRTQAGSP
jgi:hypothetical protein